MLIQRLGYSVHSVVDGRAAVERVRKGGIDIVLMDSEMPVMGGLAATAEIRNLQKQGLSPVSIIAFTAHAMTGDKERFLNAGMDDYLTKPMSPTLLEQVLERWTKNILSVKKAA